MFKHINIKTIGKTGARDDVETFINDAAIKVVINDYAEIIFMCLPNHLNSLVYGYLSDMKRSDIAFISIDDKNVFVTTKLSKNEVLDILNQKSLIGTCESIEISDSKIKSNKLEIPFNDTRYKVEGSILLGLCSDFYHSISDDVMLYHSRIISLDTFDYVDCSDTNQQTNIYKILGMYSDNLLQCAIFLDFELTLEILQKLIRAKVTFVIAIKIQNFSVLRVAQKFGLTIGRFDDYSIRILSHNSRIV